MAWIESHDDIWEHYKIDLFCEALSIEDVTAVGHLHSLWHFVLRNAWQDADLKKWGDRGIERATRWKGKSGTMVKALRDCGFLDGSVVHGWMDRAGRLVYERFRNAKRRQDSDTSTADLPPHDGGTSKATVPYRTVPNRTVPNRTTDSSSSDFEKFWSAYPKKIGKGAARKSWTKIRPSDKLLNTILKAVGEHTQSNQWKSDDGQYIPHPATWLNQTRWEDDVKALSRGGNHGTGKANDQGRNVGAAKPIPGKYRDLGKS